MVLCGVLLFVSFLYSYFLLVSVRVFICVAVCFCCCFFLLFFGGFLGCCWVVVVVCWGLLFWGVLGGGGFGGLFVSWVLFVFCCVVCLLFVIKPVYFAKCI